MSTPIQFDYTCMLEDAARTLRYLIKHEGADVNAQTPFGTTELMHTVERSGEYATEIMQVLIDANADINMQDNNGRTALRMAIQLEDDKDKHRKEMVSFLLDAGADANMQNRDGWTVLMEVIYSHRQCYMEIMRMLIDKKADLNLQNRSGKTALMFATDAGDPRAEAIMCLLLDAGADVNMQDFYGWTALMYAAVSGGCRSSERMRLLINAGADVNMQTKKGETALMLAANDVFAYLSKEIIYELAYAGTDFNKKNNSEETAIDLASNSQIKEYLQCIYVEMQRTTFARNVLLSGDGPGRAEKCDWKAYIPLDLWREIFAYAVM